MDNIDLNKKLHRTIKEVTTSDGEKIPIGTLYFPLNSQIEDVKELFWFLPVNGGLRPIGFTYDETEETDLTLAKIIEEEDKQQQ